MRFILDRETIRDDWAILPFADGIWNLDGHPGEARQQMTLCDIRSFLKRVEKDSEVFRELMMVVNVPLRGREP